MITRFIDRLSNQITYCLLVMSVVSLLFDFVQLLWYSGLNFFGVYAVAYESTMMIVL